MSCCSDTGSRTKRCLVWRRGVEVHNSIGVFRSPGCYYEDRSFVASQPVAPNKIVLNIAGTVT